MNSYALSDWLEYLSHAEIDSLKALAQSLPAHPSVVNIGSGAGTSAVAFLESRDDLFLYSIDLQAESSPFGCLEGERKAVEESGVVWHGRLLQIQGDSQEVGRDWEQGQVDLVFIDGDHSYEGCAGDIRTWLPNLRPGGILAIHDYRKPNSDKGWAGVDAAVDELLVPVYSQLDRVDSLIAFRIE
jgi:predicted O-methyltransferase YrrM